MMKKGVEKINALLLSHLSFHVAKTEDEIYLLSPSEIPYRGVCKSR